MLAEERMRAQLNFILFDTKCRVIRVVKFDSRHCMQLVLFSDSKTNKKIRITSHHCYYGFRQNKTKTRVSFLF